MADVKEQLERLLGKPRGRGRLKPAATREAIGQAYSEAVNSGADPGAGSGCLSSMTDSSGFFVLYCDTIQP